MARMIREPLMMRVSKRRINVRWNRVEGAYGGTNRSSRILGSPSARGGALCWDFRDSISHNWVTWLKPCMSHIVMGCAVRPWSGEWGDQLRFRESGKDCLILGYANGGHIYLKDSNGTVIDRTSDPHIRWCRWNYIEIKATFHNTTGSVELRHNGKTVVTAQNQDLAGFSGNYINNLKFDYRDGMLVDDIYILDPTTPGLNDFLGPVVIRRLAPTADTAIADFTPSTGTSHYACVDDDRADETDYVESATVNDDDLWDYEDVPSEIAAIKAVNIVTDAAVTGSQAKKVVSLCKSGVAAVQEVGEGVTIATPWQEFNHPIESDPNTGSPWTLSGLNAAQFGVRHKA